MVDISALDQRKILRKVQKLKRIMKNNEEKRKIKEKMKRKNNLRPRNSQTGEGGQGATKTRFGGGRLAVAGV